MNSLGRARIKEDIVRSPAICPFGRHIGAADLTLQVGSVTAVQAATTLQAAGVGSQLHVPRVGDVCDEAPNIGVEVKGLFRLHQISTVEKFLLYGVSPRIEWNQLQFCCESCGALTADQVHGILLRLQKTTSSALEETARAVHSM